MTFYVYCFLIIAKNVFSICLLTVCTLASGSSLPLFLVQFLGIYVSFFFICKSSLYVQFINVCHLTISL